MSNVCALFHIVFPTKQRIAAIPLASRDILYAYLWSVVKDNNSVLLRINGREDHVHLLINLNASVSLSDMVRDLKACSSGFLKQHPGFPRFKGWAAGYFAASVSYERREAVINYIKGQDEHHARGTFDDELSQLVVSTGLDLYPDDCR